MGSFNKVKRILKEKIKDYVLTKAVNEFLNDTKIKALYGTKSLYYYEKGANYTKVTGRIECRLFASFWMHVLCGWGIENVSYLIQDCQSTEENKKSEVFITGYESAIGHYLVIRYKRRCRDKLFKFHFKKAT